MADGQWHKATDLSSYGQYVSSCKKSTARNLLYSAARSGFLEVDRRGKYAYYRRADVKA
jgi:hypothetical protein